MYESKRAERGSRWWSVEVPNLLMPIVNAVEIFERWGLVPGSHGLGMEVAWVGSGEVAFVEGGQRERWQ